jgi:hypothetical protein
MQYACSHTQHYTYMQYACSPAQHYTYMHSACLHAYAYMHYACLHTHMHTHFVSVFVGGHPTPYTCNVHTCIYTFVPVLLWLNRHNTCTFLVVTHIHTDNAHFRFMLTQMHATIHAHTHNLFMLTWINLIFAFEVWEFFSIDVGRCFRTCTFTRTERFKCT